MLAVEEFTTVPQFDVDALINKALITEKLQILPFTDFLRVTKIKLDQYMVDKFFHSIQNDMLIYVDETLIRWCGYSGEVKEQKRALLRLLDKYKIKYEEYSNDRYIKLLKSYGDSRVTIKDDKKGGNMLYPPIEKGRGKSNAKHILIMPDNFKKVAMRLPTEKGEQVCDYYIQFEKVVNIYFRYQTQFLIKREELLQIELKESRAARKELMDKVDELNGTVNELKDEVGITNAMLEVTNRKLGVAVEERAPRTASEAKHTRLAIIKLATAHKINRLMYQYYVIRGQKIHVESKKRLKLAEQPGASAILTIEYSPNASNLFNLIKEEMSDKVSINGNYMRIRSGFRNEYNDEDLSADIHRLNDSKKTITIDAPDEEEE